MPSKSKAQAHLMAAAAHNPEIAKSSGIPQDVAQEFNQADAKDGILKKDSKKPEHVKEEMRGWVDVIQDAELSHDIDDANEQTLINTGQLDEMPQKFDAFANDNADDFVTKTAQRSSQSNMIQLADHGEYVVMKSKMNNGYIAYDKSGKELAVVSGYEQGGVFHEEAIASKSTIRGVVYQIYEDILASGLKILSDTLHSDSAIRFWQKLISTHLVYVVADGEVIAKATPEKFHKYWGEENSPSAELQLLLVK